MTAMINLKADVFELTFLPTKIEPNIGFVDYTQALSFAPDVSSTRFVRERCRLHRVDFHVLLKYLNNHLGADSAHDIEPSGPYFPMEFDFKLQALDGKIRSWSEGFLTIEWLVYQGTPTAAERSIYLGCRAAVKVSSLVSWMRSLEAVYDQIGHMDSGP